MDIHLSEEEQVEQIKKWWKENGKSVVAGVVLGLGGVFGWQYWNQHQKSVAEQAAFQFDQLHNAVAVGAKEPAEKQAEALIGNYSDTAYATFAALQLAKVKLEQGDPESAQIQLRWVLENSDHGSMKQVARLRSARILLDQGDMESAAALIAQAESDSYKGEFAELRGDIARQQGDDAGARQAYQEALNNQVSNSALVQMKLDDLSVPGNL